MLYSVTNPISANAAFMENRVCNLMKPSAHMTLDSLSPCRSSCHAVHEPDLVGREGPDAQQLVRARPDAV